MCGIAGGVNVSPQWVESALEHQKMRGPDNIGIHSIGNVIFGHNRLSIIDLSGMSNQPICQDEYKSMFTYNGEWYNFRDYYGPTERTQADTRRYFFPDLSDTLALYCNCYRKPFKEALKNVNGMFAVAYYDGENIHLAVDRFGQKPLYYYHEGGTFAFASTPAALYALKDKWELDRDALQSYWLLGSVMGENGLLKGIKKLCASEHLTYNLLTNKLTIERYWEPKFQENATVEDLEGKVLEAIRKVKVSDVPIFTFLSGGIDSTLVASQFEGGKAIHLDGDERRWAQQAADRFSIDLKVITPEDTNPEVALTDYSFKCGEPTMAGIIPWIVARETAKYGKVAISANGADELFFGYDRTSENLTDKQWRHIFRNIGLYGEDYFKRDQFYSNFKFSSGRQIELSTYIQFDLNKTLDFASMCHGLEVRAPFLDHELVEMALSIPESVHRKNGNKTILKNMLRKMGFSEGFLNRPKQGFSLHKQPKDLNKCVNLAWDWVQKEGFLDVKGKILNGRDEQYLKMSALGFYYWYKTWKHKLN